MEQVLQLLVGLIGPYGVVIFAALGGLYVLASVVVALTPSKKDDEALQKLKNIPVLGSVLSALETLSPIKRKD